MKKIKNNLTKIVMTTIFCSYISQLSAAIADEAQNKIEDEIISNTDIQFWDSLLHKVIDEKKTDLDIYKNQDSDAWKTELSHKVWDSTTKTKILNVVKTNTNTHKISLKDIQNNKITEKQIDEFLNIVIEVNQSEIENGNKPVEITVKEFLFNKIKSILDEEKIQESKKETTTVQSETEKVNKDAKEEQKSCAPCTKKYIMIGLIAVVIIFMAISLIKKVL